jgi:hypothetical protein
MYCGFKTDSCQGSFVGLKIQILYSLYIHETILHMEEKGRYITNDLITQEIPQTTINTNIRMNFDAGCNVYNKFFTCTR